MYEIQLRVSESVRLLCYLCCSLCLCGGRRSVPRLCLKNLLRETTVALSCREGRRSTTCSCGLIFTPTVTRSGSTLRSATRTPPVGACVEASPSDGDAEFGAVCRCCLQQCFFVSSIHI